MAWAALSDAYYGVYCLMIAVIYLAAALLRVTRAARPAPRPWIWLVDVLIVCFGGLIAGLVLGRGGEFTLLGVPVHVRSLYNPVLILTALVTLRVFIWWRPHFDIPIARVRRRSRRSWSRRWRVPDRCRRCCTASVSGWSEGRFVSPPIFWRSSPRGVDALSFVTPNPLHPVVQWFTGDPLVAARDALRGIHGVAQPRVADRDRVAIWRAGYRPRKRWFVLTIGFALLALGPFINIAGANTHVPGPWALLRYAPGFGLARMPGRFAIVVVLGVAVLMAGALAAIGERWPRRRRLIGAVVALLLVFELWPAPRALYSAEVSAVYDRIAADPRPVRVLVLPFGVRDGVWETGNFRPRSQYNQTRHGKALIGGYLSRISRKRVDSMRENYPTLDALIKLSENAPLDPSVKQVLDERGDRLVEQANLGYVVIDERFIPPDRAAMVIAAFKLREVQRDAHLTLYVPTSKKREERSQALLSSQAPIF